MESVRMSRRYFRFFVAIVAVVMLVSLLGCTVLAETENDLNKKQLYQPLSLKDIFFWVAFALLLLVVVFLCFLFTKSKKFKLKQREKMIESDKTYTPPAVINISDGDSENKL